MKFKTYETERLLIRPTLIEDAAFILELLNSPKWIKYIGDRKVKTLEAAEDYIKTRMLPQLEKKGFSNNTVILKSTGVKIGTCGLYDREGVEGLDISFAFLPGNEGKGFGYEAAFKLMQIAMDELNVKTISGITSIDNYASQALLEKLGLKRIGLITSPNDTEQVLLYRNN